MVLGKLSVPGRPTNLDYRRARAYCACSRCGWGCLDIFSLVYHFPFLSPSLWETARYRLKYCLKGPLSPKPTNQPIGLLASSDETWRYIHTMLKSRHTRDWCVPFWSMVVQFEIPKYTSLR